jgi:hypothetical protein
MALANLFEMTFFGGLEPVFPARWSVYYAGLLSSRLIENATRTGFR